EALEDERRAVDASVARTMVMQRTEEPRQTHVHVRGNFLALGEPVEPGVPAVLNPLPADVPADRLALARWLVDPTNPLTARVTVNRFWEQLFGTGLVPTSADFGTRGDAPSHPELLDWLAIDFVEQGWSVKLLLRTIVTSATYRQASDVTPELAERDPNNLLLARGPRFRVEAEAVRDLALAASGLLDRTLGGPSVFPPQPDGIWAAAYSGDEWTTSEGGDRWRRGIYTFLRRTSPYPTFAMFDATSRELVCTRRNRSNTPLQALALLNDPAFVEAAKGLAVRMLTEAGPEPEDRARRGFRLCLSREPAADELAILVDLYRAEREAFAADPDGAQRARALASLPPGLDVSGLDPIELAAWTVVANTLLNLDETITKS
ncbi:MAG: DUF1553 domain-containing protein, partial [Planctomycetota bacterium]|nr:DUF1553 domain-containing protein [Planctomycetota bacterium]